MLAFMNLAKLRHYLFQCETLSTVSKLVHTRCFFIMVLFTYNLVSIYSYRVIYGGHFPLILIWGFQTHPLSKSVPELGGFGQLVSDIALLECLLLGEPPLSLGRN